LIQYLRATQRATTPGPWWSAVSIDTAEGFRVRKCAVLGDHPEIEAKVFAQIAVFLTPSCGN
jgi:hypothetical protein